MKKIYLGFFQKYIALTVLIFVSVSSFAQPWTYDFGTTAGSYSTNGNSTTFLGGLAATPTGGGTYRVRVGSGGGSIALVNPGTTLGTDAELTLTSPTSASTNKFGVYDWNSPSTVAYIKSKIRTTSSGAGILTITLGTNAFASDNNNLSASYATFLASLSINYSGGAITSVVRRAASADVTISSSGFAKGTDQDFEIYGNNGASSVNYTRGGTTYTLSSQQWDLWVSGVKISPANGWAKASTLASGSNLAGFCFAGETSASNTAIMYLDDLEYSNALPSCTAQTISALAATATKIYGDAAYSVATTSTSGLTVTYASSNTAVATVDASGNVTIVGAGTANITASQAGNATYCAATSSVQALTVNPKNLTITGLTANNKVFDGTTTATLSGTPALFGVINSDNVTLTGSYVANFNNPTVGTGKPVTVSGYTLGGTKASNYTLTQPTGLTADITAASNSIDLSPATQAKGPYCNGTNNSIALTFTQTGTVTAPFIQLSNASGSFASGTTNLGGTVTGSGTLTITGTIPAAQATGSAYRVRIVSTDATPVISLDNGSDITINATPTVPTAATPAAVCQGSAVTITGAGSTNATTYTYWSVSSGGTQYITGSPVGYTVTGGNLTTPASLTNGTYNFYVQGENAALCSGTARQLVVVTINALPATPANPVAASNPSCGPTVLNTMTPSAGETLYWQGTTASGTSTTQSTATTYAITTSGTYYVRARNNTTLCWSTASGSVTVTVNTAPAITTAPVDAAAIVGATATFSVVATNAVSYQWQVSTDGGVIYNNVSTGTGGTTASYTTPATTLSMNGYKYQCIITGNAPCANVTTTAVTLTVNTAPCFSEDFSSISGGNSTATGGSSTAWAGNTNFPTVSSAYQAGGAVRIGASGASGSITSAALSGVSGNVTFSIDVKGWSSVESPISVTLNGVTQTITYTAVLSGSFETKTLSFTSVPAGSTLIIATTNGRAFVDNINLYCSAPTPVPLINVKQATTSIPNSTGSYSFGSQQVSTSSAAVTFTVENNGTATLNLTGTPKIAISGNTTDFTINQIATTATVAASGTTTFTIAFNPTALGTRTATISIANDDATKNPYTFTINGTGTNSAASTVVDNTNYSSTTPEFNITTQYINYIDATSTTTGKFIPMKFRIVDGPDADALPTILTGIKFTVKDLSNVNQLAQIKTAILTNTAGTVIATASKVGTELVFTGMSGANVTAADDDAAGKIVHLRVSLDETQVIDGTKLVFQVSSVTADVSGSSFAAANGGGAQTDANTGNQRNVLNVTATKLAFTVQPVTTAANANMVPAPVVSAVDIYNRTDIDVTGTVSVTSTGTLSASPQTATFTAGAATFSTINHTVAGTGYTLSATYGALTAAGSSAFDITTIVYVDGDYRTIGSGSWVSNSASPAIWQRRVSGVFVASNSPSYSTTNNIYIQNTHTITTGGSFSSGANIKVLSGGTFNCNHASTTASIYIYNGGSFNVNASLTNSGTLDVEDNGNLYIDNAYSTGTAPIWSGTENFRPNSNLYIYDWQNATPLITASNVTFNTYNGYTAAFGNVYIDWASSTAAATSTDWNGIVDVGTYNICHKNLEFVSTRGNTGYKIAASAAGTYGIGGNLILDAGMGASRVLQMKSGSGAVVFNVKGDVVLDCAGDLVLNSGATSTCTLNIDGNLLMNQTNTAATTEVKYTSTLTSAPTAVLATINLKGNLLAPTGSFSIAATNPITAATSSEPAILAGELNFTGTTEQQLSMLNSVGTSSSLQGISLKVKSGAIVRLVNSNLTLWYNSSLRVEDGGTFDFGFNGTTPLIVTQPTTAAGTNWFKSYQNSTLRITSPDGITTTAGVGNVQVSASNRAYDQLAKFYYIGKSNQFTGNGLTTGSTGKLVFVVLPDNNTTLTLSNNIGISNGTTLDATGGRLEIQKGIVIGTGTGDFTGSGRLVMSDGEYRISTITATPLTNHLPQLSNYANYSLTGGTVNLNGANAIQILSGVPNYYKLAFSGANTLATDYKGISTGTTVSNGIRIYETAIVDVKASTLGATGGPTFTMENTARYITAGTGVKPDATGAYSLASGTTIEFNNNGTGTLESVRLTGPVPSYANIVVSGSNVGTSALGSGANSFIQFQSGGNFTVTSTGTFKLANINGFSGASNTAVSNTNTPQINLQAGSTIEYNGDSPNTQAVSNATVNTPSGANYVNLTFNGSAVKTLPATDLTITGNLHRDGTHTVAPQTGRFIFSNTIGQRYYAETVTKPFDFYNLTNNNTSAAGLSVDSTLGVLNELKLNTGSKLVLTVGDINMRSSATRTAYIPDLGTSVPTISYTGTGGFIMERYLQAIKAWRFISTPVDIATSPTVKQAWQENGSALTSTGYGTQITGPATYTGMDAVTGTGSVKWYDVSTHTYKYVQNTNDPISNKFGYMVYVRGDRGVAVGGTTGTANLRIKGRVNTGQQTFTIPGSETQSFGNPYPSAISYDKLKLANSGLAGYYIAWDPTLNGSYGAGGYQTISSITIPAYQATATVPGPSGIYSVSGTYPNIQSGQAVFIANVNTSTLSGVVTESMKATQSILVSRGGEENRFGERSFIKTKLFTNTGLIADGNIMAYDSDFSNDIDGLDAPKFNNGGENFGLKNGTKKLSVEARKSIAVGDTVQFDMSNLREQEYKVAIIPENMSGRAVDAFFVDRYTKAETVLNLTDSNFISFAVSADASTKAANRFYIVFRKAIVPPSVTITAAAENSAHAVKVDFKAENAPDVTTFIVEKSSDRVNFQPVAKQDASNTGVYSQQDAQPSEGDTYYRIRAINADGSVFFSNIVKVSIGKVPSLITVYPNPVSGKVVHLYLNGQLAGKYKVVITSSIGQQVYQSSLTVSGRYESKELSVPGLSAGTYMLKVSGNKGELKSIQLVVE